MASQIDIASVLKANNPIVISGIGGRFPESDSMDEFAQNLYSNRDLFTVDDRRWPTDIHDMNQRMAKLKAIEKFDGRFFGMFTNFGDKIDPCSRILLETSYEAICDAGINPQSLRGSDTGVYAGYSTFGSFEGLPEDVQPDLESSLKDSMLYYQGYDKCFYSNRISFILDLKGPSVGMNTACSSSLVALDAAVTDMRLGKCNQALVIAAQINLQPFSNKMFQSFEVNSNDGISRPWDEKAAGFVRGETVASLFLQKKTDAKRIYATILHSRVNTDGNKKVGMLFPSSEVQKRLMIKTCKEANVDPLKVNYFEAHGTGTKVGDLQEARAIHGAYCVGRKDTLPIGLLKSNIGHGEGASGLSSVIKVVIAFENKCIPGNINLNKVKSGIADMCPPLFPIIGNLPYELGIAGVNNFGLGGVNAHLLLEPNCKELNENSLKIADRIPRIINICGRTQESLNTLFDFIENNPKKVTRDFLALMSDTMKTVPILKSAGFPYRGSMIIKQNNEKNAYLYKRQISLFSDKSLRPVWFLFPGLGGQWLAMAKALMPIDTFNDKIEECHLILKPHGIDLKNLLLSDDKNLMSTMTEKFVATTAIQIAMFDVLQKLDIIPDGIIGHSFGEIACAYADGCLTTKEALLTTYIRGEVTESDPKIPKGLMAVVGLSWDETKKLCPQGVDVVCNNSINTVVISGLYSEMKEFIKLLNEKNIFVRELESSQIPYHSEYLITSEKKMTEKLKKVIPNPKERSQKWISTAILNSSENKNNLKFASAEYFVHNLMSPVYFHNKLITLPKDAIVVEIGPHSLFAKIITQTLESSSYISLIKREQNDTNLDLFLTSIGKLYELGLNPSIENLYPFVSWPVARNTQSISSLMKWDHSDNYYVQKYPQHHFRPTSSDMNLKINLLNQDDRYFEDHCIDGKVLYPAAGYLMLAWRILAASRGKIWKDMPVVFEDVQFRRPVFLTQFDVTKLKVQFLESAGEFFISENNNIGCYGRIRASEEDTLHVQNMLYDEINSSHSITLDSNDVYKDLRVRGYDYGPMFKGIEEAINIDCKKICGIIKWTKNWVTFMDALLQTQAIAMPFKNLFVPVMISSLRCDPNVFFNAIRDNQTHDMTETETKEEELDEQIQELDMTVDLKNVSNEDNQDIKEFVVTEQNKRFGFVKFNSSLPFIADIDSKLIVTHGMEIKGLIALPIPRKHNRQNLKLESYQFIANEENDAIQAVDKRELMEYIKVCSLLASEVWNYIKFNEFGNKMIGNDLIEHYLEENKEEHVILKIYDKILNSNKDENQNIDKNFNAVKLNELITNIKNKPEFDLTKDMINRVSKNERIIRSILDIVSENNVPKKEIKVLEINLSNAIMAQEVDNHLSCAAVYPISVDYTIINNSIETLHEDLKNKSFKLNEWDHKKTSFPENIAALDLILYRDTHHISDSQIEKFLQEVYDTIVSKGFLLSVFRNKVSEPELILNKLYGEKTVNDNFLEKRINNFKNMAQKVGFNIICSKSDSIGSIAILFRKVVSNKIINPKEMQIIEINEDFEKWFDLLKNKINENKDNERKDENIWLIGNDSSINGIIGLTNCLRLEPGGERIRCIFDCDKQLELPLNFNKNPFSDIMINDLAINVIRNGKIGTYRHLGLPKNYDKIETNDYFLNCGQTGDLSGVQLFDSKNIAYNKTFINLDNKIYNQIRCNVYSSGLNFRDVMVASGRIASIAGLFTDCMIGLEFAGRRSDTGERVCGMAMSRCMASFVDVKEDLLTPIPENWSMEDAVTIVTTYSTVWYGLIERAQLLRNESILIHSGAGGVGQAAIAVCQYYNCDIFTTVGNEEKKKFLMTQYNIPENRILNSRDTQFEYKIMSLTEGKGVNIVLNSLTGDKLEAGFRCVSDDGRFVEIGKYDLQMNKQLGMFAFLKNISFIGVSVDNVLYFKPEYSKKFFDWMHENSSNGCIKPINRTVFGLTEAEKAFRYMLTGKHTGKILIKVREEENNKIALKQFNPTLKLNAIVKTYFDPKKVYIITGGLGGFGLELLHWMLFKGARKFVLTSRTGLKTNYQKFVINRYEAMGKNYNVYKPEIQISTHNSNTIEGSEQLLKDANKLGPIGGVFHLSLVLNDAFLENQTIETFRETCESKINTFINLDKLSRDLCLQLEYFCVFSSVSCGKGNAGQTNYGFANSVVERICEERRKDGLHGLAIQWGPIGDVGVLVDSEINTSLSGVVKQRINSCLEVLDKFLQIPYPVLSSVERANRQILSGSNEERMISQIWSALGVDPKTTPNNLTLGELGMESMVAVELQQGFEREFDIKFSLHDIKQITVKQIKEFQSGNKSEMNSFVEELKKARFYLNKIKFIIPHETHVKLNASQKGNPIYLLPPVEGMFSTLENLAKNINRPVIGLNWTQDMKKFKTMKEISVYYTDLLKMLSPNGNYDIVGHSFGGLILTKMLRKAPIGRAVIIDILSKTDFEGEIDRDNQLFNFITKFVTNNLPNNVKERISRDFDAIKSTDEKLKKLSIELKEFGGKSLVTKDLDELLYESFERGKLIIEHKKKMSKKYKQLKQEMEKKILQMSGKLFIIKPFDNSEDLVDKVKVFYDLRVESSDARVNVETVDANPDELLTTNVDNVAQLINKYLP